MRKNYTKLFFVALIAAATTVDAQAQVSTLSEVTSYRPTKILSPEQVSKAREARLKDIGTVEFVDPAFSRMKTNVPSAREHNGRAKSPKTVPLKAGSEVTSGPAIWAAVYSDPVDNTLGLYSFSAANPSTATLLSSSGFESTTFRNGVQYKDGIIYGASYNSTNRTLSITQYNTETKTTTTGRGQRVRNTTYAATETAQATDGTVYGQFPTTAGGYSLGTVDYSGRGLPKITTIGISAHAYAALGITSDGRLYGIASDGNLYKIDRATAAETLVGRTGLRIMNRSRQIYYQTGEIDPKTNTFYWLAVDANQKSGLYTVDLNTGKATLLSDVGGRMAQGMIIPNIANDAAPAMVTTASVTRKGVYDHDGTFQFTAPTKTYDNQSELTGELKYKLYDDTYLGTDDEVVDSGTIAPGADVSKQISLKADGFHRLALGIANASGESPRYRFVVVVGSDVPLPVTNLQTNIDTSDEQKVKISWTPSSDRGVNGEMVDTENLTYDVYRIGRGDTVTVATGVKASEYVDDIPVAEMKSYIYGVQAHVGSQNSTIAWTSNSVIVGQAVNGEYWKTDFNNGDFDLFSVVDGNEDNNTWERILRGVSVSTYNTASNDDWIVTPPIKLESKYVYTLYFHTSGLTFESTPLTMEVKSAPDSEYKTNSVGAMSNIIMPTFNLPSDYIYVNTEVKPSADGNYRIGFHSNSAGGINGSVFMDTIYIVKSAYVDGPDSVTALKVTPAEEGALAGTVSFNIATKLINGQKLNGVDSVSIYRDDELLAILPAHKAGEAVTYSDSNIPTSGFHTYKVVSYTTGSDGNVRRGRAGTTTVYIGNDIPKAPQNVTLNDNTDNIVAKWDPYVTGYNGENNGYIDKNDINVSLYEYNIWGPGDLVVASDKGASSVVIDHNPEKAVTDSTSSIQELYYLNASASSSQGTSENSVTGSIVVGPTIPAPYKESFKDGSIDNQFIWTDGNDQYAGNVYAAGWNHSSDLTQDGDGGGAWWAPYQVATNLGTVNYLITAGDETSLNTPKISLKGTTTPKLYFYLYAVPNDEATLKVLVAKPDGTETEVGNYDLSATTDSSWTQKSIDLSSFKSERYIMVKFLGIATGSNVYVGIDNINVFNQLSQNLKAVSISTPKSVKAGKEGKADVTVQNFGSRNASRYLIKLFVDEQPVDSIIVFNSIGVLSSKTSTLKFTAPVNKKQVSVKAQVFFAPDMDESDNTTESNSVIVTPSDYTKVSDLAASNNEGEIVLSWSKPTNREDISVTDDFESYEPFATEFGDWTLFDGDKGLALPLFRSYSYPGQGTSFAFDVFNPDAITDAYVVTETNKGLKAHSGEQYAAALYAETTNHLADVAADNWLISPELTGKAQTLTFFASNQVITGYPYNEKFDILYSTEGTDTADFKLLKNDSIYGTVRTEDGDNWKQFSYDIPDGAKYFAIHHKSPIGSCYLFGIDDISFERASLGTNDSIVAYNIYRNGELIGTVDGKTLTFTDSKPDEGANVWNVTVVYQSKDGTRNESSFSNDATLNATGINGITVDDDVTYDVYTIDGRTVRLNAKNLSGLKPGVYIINGIKQLVK